MIGLVLEGGGARGSYHIGAYRAIMEEGIEINGITGTSIGALNGAMIVQDDFETCAELWENVTYSMVINANDEEIQRLTQLRLNREDIRTLIETLRLIIDGRGFDITPFKELLDTYIDEDKIRKSPMDFGVVTVSLSDFKAYEVFKEDIPQGELKNYLLASAYLPVFKPEKLGGKIFLDGGFYDNLPFKMLQNKGYDKLILVRTHARGLTRRIDRDDDNIIVIRPSEDLGNTYILEADTCKRNMQLGYYDALKVFRKLKGQRYYVNSLDDEDYYFNLLLNLEEDKIDKIRRLLHITDTGPGRRVLLELIVPKLGSMLGLNKDFTYEDLLVGLLERKAEEHDVERFEVYGFEGLLESVLTSQPPIKPKTHGRLSPIERIIERVDLAAIFNKDEVLLKVADLIFSR